MASLQDLIGYTSGEEDTTDEHDSEEEAEVVTGENGNSDNSENDPQRSKTTEHEDAPQEDRSEIAKNADVSKKHNCDPPEIAIDDNVLSQREWRQKFIKRNPAYRRCKIRYSKFCYIKPRCAIPATGKPIIYVAEGAENWTGNPRLLCAGQLVFCGDQELVILVVMWVGCLTRRKGNGLQYCPQAKGMKVLLCPRETFDSATEDLHNHESELRCVCLSVFYLVYLRVIIHCFVCILDL